MPACDDPVIVPNKIIQVPQAETLVLHWDFSTVTGSGNSSDGLPTTSNAKFFVPDVSSGTLSLTSSYSWLGPIRYTQHPGQGDFFLPFDTSSVSKEYITSAKQLGPEVINNANLVSIVNDTDKTFTRNTKPTKYFFSLEKSPYNVVSDEILKLFSTIIDFNNLIGEPVNRYRQTYKDLEKLRALYFQRVNNSTIDFEKFVDYFKWVDSSISQVLQQLIPASAHFSDEVKTLVESHVLERNKYWSKYPNIQLVLNEPNVGIRGINELAYSWISGSAPVSKLTTDHKNWWLTRAERTGSITSGKSDVDAGRSSILATTISALNRSFTTPIRLVTDRMITVPRLTSSAPFTTPPQLQPFASTDALLPYPQQYMTFYKQPKVVRIGNISNALAPSVLSASCTGSVPLGTYNRTYEIIQTSGRLKNNRYFNKTRGTGSYTLNGPVTGSIPVYTLNDRSFVKNKFIFVELFSAPGEVRTMSRGYLDPLAEEYSVYNNINFRNLNVKNVFNGFLQLHAGFGGQNPTSSLSQNIQKTNRNNRFMINYSAVSSSYFTASLYDNGFLSRPIPQSEMQYQWVTSSLDTINNSVLGYTSDFYVNSGSASTTSSFVTLITASSIVISGITVDFAGLNTLIYDPLTGSLNALSSSQNNYKNTSLGTLTTPDSFNSLMLHRNGPYQYPSWKQVRVRDSNPIVRYFNNNNILSIIDRPKNITIITPDNNRINYLQKRPPNFTNYVEPPVSFRYKPIIHTFNVVGSSQPVSIRHSYANNLAMFSNVEINNKLGLVRCGEQAYDRLKELYLNSDMTAEENPVQGFIQLSYNEMVYPKEVNTGRAVSRMRTAYAESAPTTKTTAYNFYNNAQTLVSESFAVGDYGSNGIDRLPTQRRTFWKKNTQERNRWSIVDQPTFNGLTLLDFSGALKTSLLNSQGIADGETPSIWPFGIQLSHTQSAQGTANTASTNVMGSYTNLDFGELSPMRGLIGLNNYTNFSAGGNAEWNYHIDWSYFQNSSSTVYGVSPTQQVGRYFYQNPTCSALYTKQVFPDHMIFGSNAHVIINNALFDEYQDDFNHRFRVSTFAGKDPWFNTYEDFSQDIKGMAKEYSIIPEFNVSNNMNYYVLQQGGNFRAQNDKFLTNPGSSITQSSISETSGFDSTFFVSYVHSDFMKYVDDIIGEHDNINLGVNKITLSCKGIKKLLPYNGFYPVSRTLQLASLFSQSYAPFIGGNGWSNGKTLDSINPPSGNLAVASLLQPFYAPGILYNTIKAGIAMDFPVFTGSAAQVGGAGNSSVYITSSLNYRIQFESILDIKNGSNVGGIPISASDGSKRVYWQGVEYLSNAALTNGLKDVYFDWTGGETSPLYRLAIHNFLGESINFFLKNNTLKAKVSAPANKMKSMISGNTYYMDVRLYRSDDILMYGGRWNNTNKLYHTASLSGPGGGSLVPDYAAVSYTGKFFGHPSSWMNQSLYPAGIAAFGNSSALSSHLRTLLYSDFAYAPYLPSYYFKDNIARLSYVADGTEKNQVDPVSYVLSKIKTTNINNTLQNAMLFYNDNSLTKVLATPSWQGQSTVSSSVNLFGVSKGFKTTYKPSNFDSVTGRAIPNTIEDTDATFNSWIISPKFECPIMNFRNQPDERYTVVFDTGSLLGNAAAATSGTMSFVPKGMWSGYGNFCTGSTGVFLSVEESFPDITTTARMVTGSLIDIFGFTTDPERLGEVADFKEISEAVIAIPFVDSQVLSNDFAKTINILGKNLFAITPNLFTTQKNRRDNKQPVVNAGEYGNHPDIFNTSITNMIDAISQYVIPPELNFLKFNDVPPFVMYVFEFKHLLDRQDLADIWQGVMPKIALTAEKTQTDITHEIRPWEFFEGNKLPPQVRWMVFKVKKQGTINYFSKTADGRDDTRFKFNFQVGSKVPDYSFNWPYDYFSLIELGKIDAQVDITPLPTDITKLKSSGGADNLKNIKNTLGNSIPTMTQQAPPTRKDLLAQVSVAPSIKTNVFGKIK